MVESWCTKPFFFGYPIQKDSEKKSSKWEGIDFSTKAPKEFWKKFPFRRLPDRPSTRVKVKRLEAAVKRVEKKLTVHQKKKARETVKNLKIGAPSYQLSHLKGSMMRNANSATTHGAMFTETLENWIQEGFVAGPFLSPPLPEFRANSLMAIEQKDKVRPVLNMSYPEGSSFNDNLDEDILPKVKMSSAKQFGQAVLRAGKGALMSKMDMKDAYKHIPAKVEDFRLQGMQWMGAYFVDTQQIFGQASAVPNFDGFAETTLDVTIAECQIPRDLVHRILDDVANVAPAGSVWGQEFVQKYKENCADFNIRLATDCPPKEKAFTNSTRGTVMGIQFDTTKLAWRIADTKAAEILKDIHVLIHGGHTDLKQLETAAGRLSNFGQMCPFLKAFKRPLNNLLASFKEDYNILLPVSEELIGDLRVWAATVSHANRWSPISLEMEFPPLNALEFISDAAGGLGDEDWVGVASLGLNSSEDFWFMCKGEWPPAIINGKDEKGADFASKMTTLELVGFFLPLLAAPKLVQGRNIVMGVDNVSVVFGWENRSVKGDLTASALIRALHLVSCFLECRIFARHVPRLSSPASMLADSLTRASTAKDISPELLAGITTFEKPEPLWEWLQEPQIDWNLGFKFIDWLKTRL